MSGSTSFDGTTPFSDAEREDVREFCGYEAYGTGASGFQTWRFFTAYGELEFKLTNASGPMLQKVRQYLADLYPLRAAILAASSNIGIGSAGPFTRNPAEIAERQELYDGWRRRLARYLGVPIGPGLTTSRSDIVI